MSYNSGLKLFKKMLNEDSLNRIFDNLTDIIRPVFGTINDLVDTDTCCHSHCSKNDFDTLFDEYGDSSLKDCGETYELNFNVDKNATSKNFDVDLENNTISVKYNMENGNKKTSFSILETLPKDADTDTIEANVKDGVFNLKMEKLPLPEEDDEDDFDDEFYDEVDNETIQINKK